MNDLISKSLALRIVSAIVLVPVVLFAVYYGGTLFYALLALLVAISVYEWVTLAKKTSKFLPLSVAGVVYLFLSFFSAYMIRDTYGFAVSAVFLAALWASDIGAYICGKIIGGPKMAQAISPNKTWAGFAGGIVFTAVTILVCVLVLFNPDKLVMPVSLWALSAVFIAVSGQAGDLAVSVLKRQAHAKDSGALIPGHGGLLDRIDSLLLASPVFLLFLWGAA